MSQARLHGRGPPLLGIMVGTMSKSKFPTGSFDKKWGESVLNALETHASGKDGMWYRGGGQTSE